MGRPKGFLVWEFPTVYISQKTRVAKYLGKLNIRTESLLLRRDNRHQHRCLGCHPYAAFSRNKLWSIFRSSFSLRWALDFVVMQMSLLIRIKGMCESCVAPSLILVISMFYKKNEQASSHGLRSRLGDLLTSLHQSRRISWFYVMVSTFDSAPWCQ